MQTKSTAEVAVSGAAGGMEVVKSSSTLMNTMHHNQVG